MGLTKALSAFSNLLNCQYQVRGQPVPYEKIFSDTGLLPAIMKKADQLAQFCLMDGLGITISEERTGLVGLKVTFDDNIPTSTRLLCAIDVLVEFIQAAPSRDAISLDGLLQ